jgi:ParB-like chromosome segregation protein Spo0J
MQNSTTEMVAIESLVLDPANARKHDAKNLEAIKGSIARFGQRKPIVVDINNVVLAGNGTLTALRALGKTEVWIARTELKGAEAIAFSLADNRTSDLSVFDDEILGKTLQALREDGFDIGEIGFDVGDFETPDFKPATEGEQGKLDEKAKIICPVCDHEFTP